jgi:hypothetical protein
MLRADSRASLLSHGIGNRFARALDAAVRNASALGPDAALARVAAALSDSLLVACYDADERVACEFFQGYASDAKFIAAIVVATFIGWFSAGLLRRKNLYRPSSSESSKRRLQQDEDERGRRPLAQGYSSRWREAEHRRAGASHRPASDPATMAFVGGLLQDAGDE